MPQVDTHTDRLVHKHTHHTRARALQTVPSLCVFVCRAENEEGPDVLRWLDRQLIRVVRSGSKGERGVEGGVGGVLPVGVGGHGSGRA